MSGRKKKDRSSDLDHIFFTKESLTDDILMVKVPHLNRHWMVFSVLWMKCIA